MKFKKSCMLAVTVCATAFGMNANAAVSADEAKQLGTTLTPWGAEKAGNKDGTIPAFTGEAIKIPASYDPKDPGARPDPYADEKPLFTITAQNYTQYTAKLSEGQIAMFKTYPKYRMDVFATHRTARYPEFFQKNSLKNATECKTSNGELLLNGCFGGTPFPIPKTGTEVMWNHLLQYQTSVALEGNMDNYLTTSTGVPVLQAGVRTAEQFPIYKPDRQTPAKPTEIYFMNRSDFNAPSRRVGEVLVILDTVDSTRRAYSYIPGQRRVKLAPDVAYDTPNPVSGGSMNMDDSLLFYGALDRWNFKLVGKKENFIVYNAFKSQEPYCPLVEKMMPGNFMNPDCIRWELHRVWVVEATLKPGYRHNYSRRLFYFDEDLPGAGTADNFDSAGKIYRVSNLLPFSLYELQNNPTAQGQVVNTYTTADLARGSFVLAGSSGHGKGKGWFTYPTLKPDVFFSPEALAGEGVR